MVSHFLCLEPTFLHKYLHSSGPRHCNALLEVNHVQLRAGWSMGTGNTRRIKMEKQKHNYASSPCFCVDTSLNIVSKLRILKDSPEGFRRHAIERSRDLSQFAARMK